jgi:hypothetical protein
LYICVDDDAHPRLSLRYFSDCISDPEDEAVIDEESNVPAIELYI